MKTLKTALPVVLLVLCFTLKAHAIDVPEISPADGLSAFAVLGGAILVFRGRFKH